MSLFMTKFNYWYTESQLLALLILIIGINFTFYFPLFCVDFAHHDDYHLFGGPSSFKDGPAVYSFLHAGRFLAGYFWYFVRTYSLSIESLKFVRFVFLVLISMWQVCVFSFLCRLKFSREYSFALSVLLGFIPTIQVGLMWIVSSVSLLPAIFFASMSGFFAVAFLVKSKSSLLFSNTIRLTFMAISLLVSLFFYQPGTMIFWGFIFLYILVTDKNEINWRSFAVVILLACLVLVIYKFLWGYILSLYGIQNDRWNFTDSPIDRIFWLIKEPILSSLNLWSVEENISVVGYSLVIILLSAFLKQLCVRSTLHFSSFTKYLASLVLLFLTTIPIALVSETFAPYRTRAGVYLVVLSLGLRCCFSLIDKPWQQPIYFIGNLKLVDYKVASFIGVLIILAGSMTSYNLSAGVAFPASMELNTMLKAITSNKRQNSVSTSIVFLEPEMYANPFGFRARYDEFGITSSQFVFNRVWMVHAANSKIKNKDYKLGSFVINNKETNLKDTETLLIDIRPLSIKLNNNSH